MALKRPTPIIENDINPTKPVFVDVGTGDGKELLAHEIKNFGCLVVYNQASMCFIQGATIMQTPDKKYKLGRK